jgi:hypothetical protein
MTERVFYKLDIQGIVYLVDPATGTAYTYDLTNPTEIGQILWSDAKAPPRIRLRDDWQLVLATKVAHTTNGVTYAVQQNADAKAGSTGPSPVESTTGGAPAGAL